MIHYMYSAIDQIVYNHFTEIYYVFRLKNKIFYMNTPRYKYYTQYEYSTCVNT